MTKKARTKDQLRTILFEEILEIAPEAEPDSVPEDADMREELDLDSMDFLNLVIALHARLGVDIPESDYPRLFTIAAAVDYLQVNTGDNSL